MPYPSEHSARVISPDKFQKGSFRRFTPPNSDVVRILGRLKGETTTTTQAYRFPKDAYTPRQAQQWLRAHHVKVMKFEPASTEIPID